MRKEMVEIYSDASNQAIMRHPGRRYPGSLIQGDSLHILCKQLDAICQEARHVLEPDTYVTLNDVRNSLWERLNHYKSVLTEHGIEMPFNDQP